LFKRLHHLFLNSNLSFGGFGRKSKRVLEGLELVLPDKGYRKQFTPTGVIFSDNK
jgi:hypothetical protein